MNTRYIKRYAALVVFFGIAGCSHLSFYGQAIRGHFNLITQREPIEVILSDPGRNADLLAKLRLARKIRDFASEELALPDNGSYRSYVDVGRRYVTWAVFAAPGLSLEPRLWCFPVAGCVPYRGYFNERDALAESEKLQASGMDTYVRGVAAYSTLGWFDDPVINTMLLDGEISLASLIFHELAHQRVYVDDDSNFNEAFAMAVQQTGVRRWLRQMRSNEDLEAYEQAILRQREFYALIIEIKQQLAVVYDSALSDADKRNCKQAVIASARQRYVQLKQKWGGYAAYDGWFEEPLNNAKLAATAVYLDKVSGFVRLLKACDGNYSRFYRQVELIADMPLDQRYGQFERATGCTADPG